MRHAHRAPARRARQSDDVMSVAARRRPRIGLSAVMIAGVLLAGSGGDDQPSACGDITASIGEGARALRDIAEDPSAAQEAFQKIADDLRTAGESAGPVVK